MNAIVWLYRGETDKYQQLIEEYHSVLGDGDFEEILHAQENCIKELRSEAKAAADSAAKKTRKGFRPSLMRRWPNRKNSSR